MSVLLMVRHGQASFGEPDYDKLSEMGVAQSALLGRYWVKRGQRFDALITGEQKRQRGTLEVLCRVYREAGIEVPEPKVHPAFNEYDAGGILKHYLPKLLEEEPGLEETVNQALAPDSDPSVRRKAFQEVLTVAMDRWIAGEAGAEAVESWKRFTDRVVGGVREITAAYPSGKTVAVITSGGPISAVLQFALGTSDRTALTLGWVIKNASITEFKYKDGRFTLTGFNMTPHLDRDALETYR